MLDDGPRITPLVPLKEKHNHDHSPPIEFTFPSLLDLGPARVDVEEVVPVPVPVEDLHLGEGPDDVGVGDEVEVPETDSGEVTPSPHGTTSVPPPLDEPGTAAAEPTEDR